LALTLFATFVAFAVTRDRLQRLGRPQLTAYGRSGIEELQGRLGKLKELPYAAMLGSPDLALLTAVGVFGMSILAGSPYDAFAVTLTSSQVGDWIINIENEGGCGGDSGCGGCGGH